MKLPLGDVSRLPYSQHVAKLFTAMIEGRGSQAEARAITKNSGIRVAVGGSGE